MKKPMNPLLMLMRRENHYYYPEFALRVGFHEPELLLRLAPEGFRGGVGSTLEPDLQCLEELAGS